VSALPDLSLNQWVVLATVAERPTHGFAIAALVGAKGDLGQVWTISRPLVYRALDDLLRLGLVEPVRTEPGSNNVRRTIVAATTTGLGAARIWLDQPVEHVRDVRSVLLAKLAFLDRAGRSPRSLLEGEQARVTRQVDGLRARAAAAAADVFSGTLSRWRLHQAESVQRFLAEELDRLGGA
jgi:DNA-binding PadR family transcriptional regulator